MAYDLFPEIEREVVARANASLGIGDPDFFTGFGKGAGMYTMRGFAETARAIDLLGAVAPIALDKLTGGTRRQEEYFAEHDDVFNRAVDYWTPKPGEVGAAGQIVGSLAGTLPQIIVNPALGVGGAVLAPAEDLTRSGVNPKTAVGVGMVQGAALAAGIRMPFLGKTLLSRMGSGAVGNLAQSMTAAAISREALREEGRPEAAQFDPFDPAGRAVDVLMGLAFGGLAHVDAKAQAAYRAQLGEEVKSAILTLNQANQLEATAKAYTSKVDLPENLNVKVNAIQAAVEQALRGEDVSADRGVRGLFANTPEAQTRWEVEVHGEAARAAGEMVPAEIPIEPSAPVDLQAQARRATEIDAQIKDLTDNQEQTIGDVAKELRAQGMKARDAKKQAETLYQAKLDELTAARTPKAPEPAQGAQAAGTPLDAGQPPKNAPDASSAAGALSDPIVETAKTIAAERPDMLVPTGETDAAGNPVSMSAADYMAHAAETARLTKADESLFKTAITCLLGVL